MKVVLDTNVLLSAFLTDCIWARILRRARNTKIINPRDFESLFDD